MRFLLAIPFTLFLLQAQAADGGLQRALLEAACANAKITRLPSLGQIEVYEASCFKTSQTRIKIVCTAGRCIADHPGAGRDDPNDEDMDAR